MSEQGRDFTIDKNWYFNFISDEKGKPIEPFSFRDTKKMQRIAEKRTHGFALDMTKTSGNISLREALARAYMQGMYDAVTDTKQE